MLLYYRKIVKEFHAKDVADFMYGNIVLHIAQVQFAWMDAMYIFLGATRDREHITVTVCERKDDCCILVTLSDGRDSILERIKIFQIAHGLTFEAVR